MLDAYESQLNTMQNYQELAQRTAADPSPELFGRFLQKGLMHLLQESLEDAADTGIRLDQIKKRIFYGKETDFPYTGQAEITDNQKQLLVNENGRRMKVVHGIIGLITEAGELAEALLRFLKQGEDFDFINLKEEAGDNQWYMAELLEGVGTNFTEVQRLNIAKLAARYGDKFSEFLALNRDLDKERGVLEEKDAQAEKTTQA